LYSFHAQTPKRPTLNAKRPTPNAKRPTPNAKRPNAYKMKIDRFEDLEIWQEARELTKLIFELTSYEPFVNDFRFRDQIRAAAGSIMDNT